jgi:hypothetical protein
VATESMRKEEMELNRIEKKQIRLKITTILDEKCRNCKLRNVYEAHDYCFNHCNVGIELQSLSSKLENNMTGKVACIHSNDMNDQVKSGHWDEEEELYLINHLHYFDTEHLATRLNRDYQSVYNKIMRLKGHKKLTTFHQ